MITAVEIKNFKCFRHLRLPLKGLTLFTGFNSGGKSSAIQPLLLLAQGLRAEAILQAVPLNGPLVRLGTVGDVLPADVSESVIEIRIEDASSALLWTLDSRAGDRFLRVGDVGERMISDGAETAGAASRPNAWPSQNTRRLRRLTYLSAVREGTSEAFPVPDVDADGLRDVGTDGRFAAYWYDQFADNEVPETRRHPGEAASSIRKQLDAWVSSLFPGSQANAQMIPQISMLSLQYRLSEIGAWRRPANVGYGLTYAFPILVALLIAELNQIVVIDSPEAHLHPSAQSQMGRVLAHFAAAGVQILVETHSDHLLNGARLAVKERTLSHDALQIHFFTGAKPDGHGVISPLIDPDGRINEWPDGFFDQSERDLSRLAGWE
jgi:predicted ATPase